MRELIFDIETDGFLDVLTKVHCIALTYGDEAVRSFHGEEIKNALAVIEQAEVLVGHNIADFDLPALRRVYPSFNPKGLVRDTLIMSRLIWPDITEHDYPLCKRGGLPTTLIGRHTLEAWGYRVGERKGTFGKTDGREENEQVWATWSEEMEAYCRQDVEVTRKLWKLQQSKKYSEEAIQLEHDFRAIIAEQEREGFPFDMEGASAFYADLVGQRAELDRKIQEAFPPWETRTTFTPKVNNSKLGYQRHVPFVKVKLNTLNPNSDRQVAERLRVQRKWEPVDFTDTGQVKVSGDILRHLGKQWPEAALLADRADIAKVVGMVSEGDNAWLKLAKKGVDGVYRLHGRVICNGATTGRAAHFKPNLAQVPAEGDLGKRCRSLFTTIPGYSLLGWDASGLELRMLAHFLARYDGGEYVKLVTEGDVHTHNQTVAGLPTRGMAKTFIYGLIYGAGGWKLGSITGVSDEDIASFKGKSREWDSARASLEKKNMGTSDVNVALELKGRKLKAQFLKGLPALAMLKDAVETRAREAGFLSGLDGRVLGVRAVYSSLNLLLQSAGAIVMKKADVIWDRKLREAGLRDKVRQICAIHDEYQALVQTGYEKEVGDLAIAAIKEAGAYFKLRCPLDGAWKAGRTWSSTH
ncbi:MAG: DNA polymerase [Cetobacterium sp.]